MGPGAAAPSLNALWHRWQQSTAPLVVLGPERAGACV